MAVRRVIISQEIGELRDCGILSVSGRWNLSAGRVRWKSVRFQRNMVSVEERRYDKIAGIISILQQTSYCQSDGKDSSLLYLLSLHYSLFIIRSLHFLSFWL